MQTRHPFLYQVLALIVTVMWGFNYISTKALFLHGLGPFGLLALKLALAWGVLVLIAPKWLFSDSPHHEVMFALLGLTYVPLYHGLESLAIYHGQVSSVAAIMASAPLMTAAIAVMGVKRVRVHWTMWLGVATATTGVLLILIDTAVINSLSMLGCFLALGGALAWAIYAMFLKSFAGYPPSFIMRKAMGYGLLVILPIAYTEGSITTETLTDPFVLGNLAFLSFGVMVLAAVLWIRITHELGSDAIAGWNYLVPILASIVAVAGLHESLTFIGVMGMLMILGGVWAGQVGAKRISAAFALADAVPTQ